MPLEFRETFIGERGVIRRGDARYIEAGWPVIMIGSYVRRKS